MDYTGESTENADANDTIDSSSDNLNPTTNQEEHEQNNNNADVDTNTDKRREKDDTLSKIEKALKRGKKEWGRSKIMIVGEGRAGMCASRICAYYNTIVYLFPFFSSPCICREECICQYYYRSSLL